MATVEVAYTPDNVAPQEDFCDGRVRGGFRLPTPIPTPISSRETHSAIAGFGIFLHHFVFKTQNFPFVEGFDVITNETLKPILRVEF